MLHMLARASKSAPGKDECPLILDRSRRLVCQNLVCDHPLGVAEQRVCVVLSQVVGRMCSVERKANVVQVVAVTWDEGQLVGADILLAVVAHPPGVVLHDFLSKRRSCGDGDNTCRALSAAHACSFIHIKPQSVELNLAVELSEALAQEVSGAWVEEVEEHRLVSVNVIGQHSFLDVRVKR
jgi:hypothetical protein